jgi:1-acyl-sn-glycerol-3-phosphate acyltransferase
MLLSVSLLALYVAIGLPAALIAVPYTLVTGKIALMYRWAMGIVRIGARAVGLRRVIHGREHICTQKQYIFLANHLSNLDPVVLLPEIPVRITVFIKRSLLKIPILGYCMRLASFIPVDRSGDADAARASVLNAEQVLATGVSVVSFVEGTRSRDGRLLPFKKGPFYLAMATNAPIVPVSIYGTETMMGKGSLAIRRGTAHVIFHPPIMPADYPDRDALMEAVRAQIASGLPEWMRS